MDGAHSEGSRKSRRGAQPCGHMVVQVLKVCQFMKPWWPCKWLHRTGSEVCSLHRHIPEGVATLTWALRSCGNAPKKATHIMTNGLTGHHSLYRGMILQRNGFSISQVAKRAESTRRSTKWRHDHWRCSMLQKGDISHMPELLNVSSKRRAVTPSGRLTAISACRFAQAGAHLCTRVRHALVWRFRQLH